ncbi:MAG: PQQ-dependent sugar dehydrogenase [Pseudomonadota bacterium]
MLTRSPLHPFLLAGAPALALSACSGEPSASATNASSTFAPAVTEIASGLEFPWGIAVLPNGDMLVTEREGRLRLIRDGALVESPVGGAPSDALVLRQGGYLDVALHPAFETNRLVYMSYSKGTEDENHTVLARGTLSEDSMSLEGVEEIFAANMPGKKRGLHFGSRIEFLNDGTMLVGLGDGFSWMDEAQNTANHFGKVVRLNDDGTPAADNPFTDTEGADPAVFTYGHRNVQGLAYDSERDIIYAHEHGPKGGDELNILTAGTNYGWPEITYGVNYDGSVITGETEKEGMAQPVVKWVPSIAPSGMVLYTGDVYPGWTGDLFIGAMNGPAGRKLVRVDLDDNGQPLGTEEIELGDGLGFRDVVHGADGHLYLATSDLDGAIYRIDIAETS